MDFAFSEEQQMLAAQVRSYLNDRFPAEKVAELAESEAGWDPSSWSEIAELGLVGLSAPEAAGGSGMTFLDEAVVLEEMGAALYPGPYLSSVALAQPALEAAPELLGEIAGGGAAASFAGDGTGRDVSATPDGDVWRLSGRKTNVPDLGAADVLVVDARTDAGVGLWAVKKTDISFRTSATMDSTRRMGTADIDTTGILLAEPGAAADVLRRIRLRALAGAAVEAVGVAQRALDLGRAYVSERKQFDKPIGAYQAVSHQVADTYMNVELARSLAYWAAWCVAEDDAQADAAALAAKSFASDTAVDACEKSIQVHGGIGFTWEHPLHRYYKRAQWLQAFQGFPREQRSKLAEHLFS
jgi:alkylation response protein AidB-like acyl-CoA dehydrogenase